MFSYPALLWGLPVIGLVVLIHLINMFRHRRVPWAAMEFLLAGYKKSRTRILLQQLLLILVRSLLVALIILMLAQPKMQGPLADMIAGAKPTLHFVLLDDSFSMSDRNAGQIVMDDARSVLQRIVEHAQRAGKNQKLTLLRFSRSTGKTWGDSVSDSWGDFYDFDEKELDEKGFEEIQERLPQIHTSETAIGVEDALAAAVKRFSEYSTNYRGIVYLISDFRARDWEQRDSLHRHLQQLKDKGITVRFIRVIETQHSNLAIREVKPVPGIHAADVPILLDATLANFGEKPVENVHFNVSVDGRSQSGQSVPAIEPGREANVRFPIRLVGGGEHRVRVQLEPDAIACDNEYSLVLKVPQELSVLLLDSKSANAPPNLSASSLEDRLQDAYAQGTGSGAAFLRAAISPEGVRTGIRAQVEAPEFLGVSAIRNFDLVVFLDLPQLDPPSLRALEAYLRAGGSVVFFTGPGTDPHFVNEQLFKNGEGPFPVSLLAPETLLPDYLMKEPDLSVSEHPMFRLFSRDGSALLRAVTIERFYAIEANSLSNSEGKTKVLGQLRNGSPLILESNFGRGRVVTFLTTAAPTWNDWARGNPSFVITMLEMVAYLASPRLESTQLHVGSPIVLEFDPASFDEKVRITPPEIKVENEPATPAKQLVLESLPNAEGLRELQFEATGRSGFYETFLTHRLSGSAEGSSEMRTFAVNVDYAEGNLALEEKAALSELLHPLGFSLEEASTFSAPFELTVAESLSDVLLILIVVLLCGEILLAGRLLPPQKKTRKQAMG